MRIALLVSLIAAVSAIQIKSHEQADVKALTELNQGSSFGKWTKMDKYKRKLMKKELRKWLEEQAETSKGITLENLWVELNTIYQENTGESFPEKKRMWITKKFKVSDVDKNGICIGDEVYDLIKHLKVAKKSKDKSDDDSDADLDDETEAEAEAGDAV